MLDLSFCYITCAAVVVTVYWPSNPRHEIIYTTGPPAVAVSNISMYGIVFRDAAPTFLEPHGIPSGGDWSLQRTAAVLLQGSEGVNVDHCTFKYLGGVGFMLSGYNRGASVLKSSFSYLGGSAMASWGFTSSSDPEIPKGNLKLQTLT